jgi:sortase A
MTTDRSPQNGASHNDLGGRWLPRLLTWGGVFLMCMGVVIALPVLQDYWSASDAQSLEFTVTLPPAAPAVALQPTPTLPFILSDVEEVISENQAPTLDAQDANPGVQETPTVQAEATATLAAIVTATPTPTTPPTPTAIPTLTPVSLASARLVIPAINLDAPIVEVGWETHEVNGEVVGVWDVPHAFAAGWHKNSALPGQVGNMVLSGHHNIYGEVFRDLVDLEPGDGVSVYVGETVYHYSVTERHILEERGQPVEVRMQNAQWIMPTEDERLTLVTCWPYTNNTHRLIVVALPVQPANPVE